MSNGYIIVDDSDAQLQYSGLWTSGGGSVNYGTSLQLIGDYTPGGSCALSISLDSAPPAEHSTPNVTAPSYHQTIWESSNIPDGNHTLVYSVQSCSSTDPDQEFVWLDYILYEPTSGAGPSGAKYFVDDTSPQASWEGELQTSMQAGDFNQTVHVLEKDSSVRFSFTGTRAIVYGRLNSNTSTTPAQAKVQLDNKSAVSFGISVAQANVQFHDTGTVDDGDHTLVLTTKSDTAIAIDYFIVRVDSSKGPAPATKEGGISTGIIAGAAIAGALVLLAIGVYFFRYRPKQRTAPSKEFTKSAPSLSPRPCEWPVILPFLIHTLIPRFQL
ncbi:hypothetical protein CYLTODRAFT_162049 [Cylindrobasidium torrendii FP15055 ss-10]|uniref:Uncharacterized protein n=1 Tax=Cylindrobasidium torrendii FP15055 ss-10 TaxID=1314674 RepID=A0A0D7AWX7_9AGAR|nr:hypothetical protein CYLTODRAFT_162049 [Cylindrobasidium torrendii FP15055 ss-10]